MTTSTGGGAQRIVQCAEGSNDGSGVVVAYHLAVPELAVMKAGVNAEKHVAAVGFEYRELSIRPIKAVRKRRLRFGARHVSLMGRRYLDRCGDRGIADR